MLQKIIYDVGKKVDVLIFPAGFFSTYDKYTIEKVKEKTERVMNYLQLNSLQLTICYGHDFDLNGNKKSTNHQLAVAVNKEGICGLGRKFYPTKDEKKKFNNFAEPFGEEHGYSRILEIKGKKAYLAVCYDIYGIRKNNLNRQNVNFIINLIHYFNKSGKGSGCAYFSKSGLAGASKAWCCPVFGSVEFVDRDIVKTWPTGVFCKTWNKQMKSWCYKDYAIKNSSKPYERLYACVNFYNI